MNDATPPRRVEVIDAKIRVDKDDRQWVEFPIDFLEDLFERVARTAKEGGKLTHEDRTKWSGKTRDWVIAHLEETTARLHRELNDKDREFDEATQELAGELIDARREATELERKDKA
jgi:hypothetical protein